MSPYEEQSIAVAKAALATSIWADVFAGFALVAVIAGGIIAYRTLKAILAQLRASQWSTLLSLEEDMAKRGEKFQELFRQLNTSTPPQKEHLEAAKENYFNSIDRLASLILNGQFPEREMKQDYRDLIKETIRTSPADFNTGTRWRKMVKLHDKWEDA